ncbi:ABC transporter ATP-binding protein [Candidatus Woesearchaeota archaeon]|nr:ABC transporter ATP-binding protein [Candidatus Woesearchaeota archaeon]
MLDINNISLNFGGLRALDHCSVTVKEGSITALIGPNGSGKSTLFNVISGLLVPDHGHVYLKKIEITEKEPHVISALGLSRTFQEVRLFKNLTIEEHLKIALATTDQQLLTNFLNYQENFSQQIHETLQLVGLHKPLTTYGHSLSYGQRKLLDLALAFAKPHSILLLDEPVAGVNPALRKQIKHLLKKFQQQGETVLLIEHDMNFVMDLADYIFVMDYGKVIAEGLPSQIRNNKKVLDAYLGV